MKKKLSIILGLGLIWGVFMLGQVHLVNAQPVNQKLVSGPITSPITSPISYFSYVFGGKINYRSLTFRFIPFWPYLRPVFGLRPAANVNVSALNTQTRVGTFATTNTDGLYSIAVSETSSSSAQYNVGASDNLGTYFFPRQRTINVEPSRTYYSAHFWGFNLFSIPQAPRLNRISPDQGPKGTRFTLSGGGFEASASANQVVVERALMPSQFNQLSNNGQSLSFILSTAINFQPNNTYQVYVINANGQSNSLSLKVTLECLVCKADINGDGVVNILDFSRLAACFNKRSSQYDQRSNICAKADLNGDGVVTILDFSILSTQFGKTVPSNQSVPNLKKKYPSNHSVPSLKKNIKR